MAALVLAAGAAGAGVVSAHLEGLAAQRPRAVVRVAGGRVRREDAVEHAGQRVFVEPEAAERASHRLRELEEAVDEAEEAFGSDLRIGAGV